MFCEEQRHFAYSVTGYGKSIVYAIFRVAFVEIGNIKKKRVKIMALTARRN